MDDCKSVQLDGEESSVEVDAVEGSRMIPEPKWPSFIAAGALHEN